MTAEKSYSSVKAEDPDAQDYLVVRAGELLGCVEEVIYNSKTTSSVDHDFSTPIEPKNGLKRSFFYKPGCLLYDSAGKPCWYLDSDPFTLAKFDNDYSTGSVIWSNESTEDLEKSKTCFNEVLASYKE